MSNKSTSAYKSVFDYVHKKILPLDAKGIMTDFERAMRNGLKSVVPETPLYCCWFHHCQCLRRRVATDSQLFQLIKTDKKAKEFYRTFQCLALLPASKIEDAFVQLAYDVLREYKQFEQFIRYYDHQWIKSETPDSYSVFLLVKCLIYILEITALIYIFFQQDTRTTAAAEAFNGKCGKSFKTHGNLFNFVSVYQREEAVKSNELERDVNGLIQKDTRKKKFKDRSFTIEHYSRLLLNEKITVSRFLKTMACMDNKIVFEEHEYPALEPHEIVCSQSDHSNQTESPTKQHATDCIDETPVIYSSESIYSENVNVPERNIELPNVSTRSQARKRATKEQHQPSSAATNQAKTIRQATVTLRTRKRRIEENHHSQSAKRTANNSDTSNSNLEAVTEITSTTVEINRLYAHFNRIINEDQCIDATKSSYCVMGCNRQKATVLLPCQHQPICNQCFVLWKVFVDENKKTVFCPICKSQVMKHIAVNCG